MTLLKSRVAATNQHLKELQESRKVADKVRRQQYKQSAADRQRKTMLVGESVLRRLDRGQWDETAFRQMMDEDLSRPADRALFGLDEPS